MRKTIKNTFALAALLIAGATSTVNAQSLIIEKEGTIIQTEQVNGGLKMYSVQDANTGTILKTVPMQNPFQIGEIVDYTVIVNAATNGTGSEIRKITQQMSNDVKDTVIKLVRR